ncbi:unnamed protein product [Rhizophagus irregularis]|nr:unnamed protein product [Rhizophagus irregularis]
MGRVGSERFIRPDLTLTRFMYPVFEPSNAARHATELYEIVAKTNKPYLFLYTDGGPDHQDYNVQLVISLTTVVIRVPIFFSIKKCRSPQDIFNTLDHLPDPVPANNEHYKNFSDVYHMDTGESYCPSIQARKAKLNKHKKKQRRDTQNVGMTVTCMDCNKSRCLYASKKITEDEKKILMAHLDTVCYTC